MHQILIRIKPVKKHSGYGQNEKEIEHLPQQRVGIGTTGFHVPSDIAHLIDAGCRNRDISGLYDIHRRIMGSRILTMCPIIARRRPGIPRYIIIQITSTLTWSENDILWAYTSTEHER
jgi:hypothetical protein